MLSGIRAGLENAKHLEIRCGFPLERLDRRSAEAVKPFEWSEAKLNISSDRTDRLRGLSYHNDWVLSLYHS